MQVEKFKIDDFLTICERLKKQLSIKKDKQLIDIIGTSQPTFSRRKKENKFAYEWAFDVGKEFNLLTEWILTGEGPKQLGDEKSNNYFSDLETWAKETGKSENIDWMKNQIDQTFPMFKEWRNRREETKRQDSKIPASKVA